jgi:uncharacterized membrane protein
MTPGQGPANAHTGPYSPTDAFGFGWKKFVDNIGPILIGMLVLFVAAFVINVVWNLFVGLVLEGATGVGLFASLLFTAVTGLIAFVVQFLIQAAITRAALALTDGRPIELQTLFSTDQLPAVILGSILISIAASIGLLLCIIPGLVVYFFAQFFVHFAIDKRLDAIEAIKASFAFVNANVGQVLVFTLLFIGAYIAGAILCGIGLLVAVPVAIIAQAYTFRRLQGEPVAA